MKKKKYLYKKKSWYRLYAKQVPTETLLNMTVFKVYLSFALFPDVPLSHTERR